ncbi:MAG: hypothetical protein EBR33_12085 [Synechococcaceae bacterium WB4_1_0192]|nr:hypothetical protein [Synechococcaceae bacterium WB4_1_0192]
MRCQFNEAFAQFHLIWNAADRVYPKKGGDGLWNGARWRHGNQGIIFTPPRPRRSNGDLKAQRRQGKASAETALHLAIVEQCGAGAVLHTHSQAGTLLSQWALQRDPQTRASGEGRLELADLEMLKGLQGFTSHACVARVPVLANDQNLPRLASRALPLLADAPQGLLIAGHGLYAWGSDLATARRHLEILEFLLEQRWRQLLLEALLNPPQVPHQSGTQSTVTHTEATPPSSSPRP